MNEENNKKRNKIIIIVAVLFLLTAGIITVYSFKDTKAEEIDGETVDSSSLFSLFVSPTVSCPTGFEMRKGASGCIMNKDTLKKIPGFAKKVNGNWIKFGDIILDNELVFYQVTELYNQLAGNGETPSTSILTQDALDNYNGNISYADCSSLKCFEIKINSAKFNNEYILFNTENGNSDVYKSVDNYHIYANPVTPGDGEISFVFNGNFIYIFPESWFNDKYNDIDGFIINKDTVNFTIGEKVDFSFNKPIANVTLNLNEENSTSSISRYVILDTNSNSDAQNSGNATWYFKVGTPTKTGYIFDGWTTEHDYTSIVGPDNDGYYTINIVRGITTHGSIPITLKAVWEKEDSSLPRLYSVYYKDSAGNNTVDTKTDSSSDFTINNGKTDYCVGTDANKMFSYWKNMTDTSDTNKYCLDTASGCTKNITIPSGKTSVTLKAVCNSNSGGGNTPKYTLTLKKNCSGTFKCVSDTNSEVCNQLKNNGKFTKTITKGDTFTFPKTFDTLTCDGNEINSWGSFELGQELEINSNITASAKWKSSSGGGDTPSTDEYTVTLKKNCSGTFVCSSSVNSEVCNQLKSNGKFTKNVTKGDTFIFPKTFDTLTCNGNEINSWGNFELGQELEINSNITASAKWKSSSGGGDTPSTDEYTVTLKKNCSGTFKCVSDKNSEVCNQLKNNGKFTKNVTKGDTFIFPKTFDTLTCDGENIDKWGIYNLGSSITVNSNITTSANWKNSSSNDDPIDDPIDNPQTGSIVIYLVLLFGIGALTYSVWYFRGFREN